MDDIEKIIGLTNMESGWTKALNFYRYTVLMGADANLRFSDFKGEVSPVTNAGGTIVYVMGHGNLKFSVKMGEDDSFSETKYVTRKVRPGEIFTIPDNTSYSLTNTRDESFKYLQFDQKNSVSVETRDILSQLPEDVHYDITEAIQHKNISNPYGVLNIDHVKSLDTPYDSAPLTENVNPGADYVYLSIVEDPDEEMISESIKIPAHDNQELFYVMLGGQADLIMMNADGKPEEKRVAVKEGDIFMIPPGYAHELYASSETPVKALRFTNDFKPGK